MFGHCVILLLTLVLAPACSQPNPEDRSQLQGLPLGAASSLAQPPRLKPTKTVAIGHALTKIGQKAFLVSGRAGSGKHPGRKALQISYIKAISESGGIPRPQGEDLLHKLLSDDYGSCDGLSCSRVFGVDPQEVPQFFEETFFEVSASKAVASSGHAAQRKLLLASLAKEKTLSGAKDASPKEQVARLFLKEPEPIPQRAVPPISPITHALVERKVGSDFIHALEGFSMTDFASIRTIESYFDDELLAKGWSPAQIAAFRLKSDHIHQGFAKLPTYKGFVYRGLARLPAEQILSWIKKMEQRQVIGLGALDRSALTSASWDPRVAGNFANLGNYFHTYSVLMLIEQKRGLAIDEISLFKNEREVILPRDGLYLIESMAPAMSNKGQIIMKLREVPKETVQATAKKAA